MMKNFVQNRQNTAKIGCFSEMFIFQKKYLFLAEKWPFCVNDGLPNINLISLLLGHLPHTFRWKKACFFDLCFLHLTSSKYMASVIVSGRERWIFSWIALFFTYFYLYAIN